MSTEITETEVAAGDLQRVTLGGTSFRVARTPTLRYMFWMRAFLGRFQAGEITDDDIVDCYDQTVALLRRYNKQVDEEKLQDSCELVDLIGFYSRAFGVQDEDEGEGEGDGRPPRRRRGTTGPPRSASKSRS